MQGALAPYGVQVVGIDSFGEVPDVEKDGATLLDNAIKKASIYAATVGGQVLSMDNGLYFEGLSDEEQPGTHVRRINGIDRATDDEVLRHYIDIIAAHGGQMNGRFEYAIVLAQSDGTFVSTSLSDSRFFTATPCPERQEGYPLESICIDPASGKYVAEISPDEQAGFWQRSIGKPVGEFVSQHLVEQV
jgi:XTP/dITP diphosphohydrolase